MASMDRRRWITAAAALTLTPSVSKAAREALMYDYLFLDFGAPPAARPAAAYVEHVRRQADHIAKAGGEIVGCFTPQLGWRAGQAALLVGWRPDAAGRDEAVARLANLPGVRNVIRDRLTPTARPSPGDQPASGGIYVHRWFVIDKGSLAEFVQLSTQGWADFEARFDTRIFGLFTAAPTPEEAQAGRLRLLLVTRYGDHGVWETSRDPSTDAMAAFLRRQRLTHDTWAASTLLTRL